MAKKLLIHLVYTLKACICLLLPNALHLAYEYDAREWELKLEVITGKQKPLYKIMDYKAGNYFVTYSVRKGFISGWSLHISKVSMLKV